MATGLEDRRKFGGQYGQARLLAFVALLALCATHAATDEEAEVDEGVQKCIGIGIDLGTTFSVAAFTNNDNVEVINNAHGNSITPSIVSVDAAGQIVVGEQADALTALKPKDVIVAVKRIIGRNFDDPIVQKEKENVPYEIVADKNGFAAVKLNGKVTSPEEISSEILKAMMQQANRYIQSQYSGDKANLPMKAVITVPAYFSDPQRKSTKKAAALAGIDTIQLLSEPVAAAIASKQLKDVQGHIIVLDLGGGTYDVSVLEVEDGVYTSKATTGDLSLGGVDFTNEIVAIIKEKATKNGDALPEESALQKEAEQVKIALSSALFADYEVGSLSGRIYKSVYETAVNKKYAGKIVKLAQQAIDKAGIRASDVKKFLLAGGSSRSPFVQRKVKDHFGIEPIVSDRPDHAIAEGAAIAAALACGHADAQVVLISQTVFGYAVKTISGTQEVATFIIDPNVEVPYTNKKTFSTYSDNQPAVTVEILQGYSSNPAENTQVGTIQYDGIPMGPAGSKQVEIEFHISEDQVITAKVTGKYEGAKVKEEQITLHSSKMDEAEIKRMQEEAKEKNKRYDFIVEIESAFSEPLYAIKSELTASAVEPAHKSFVEDTKKKWDELKAMDLDLESFKDKAKELMEEAKPVFQKVVEAKNKALAEYQQKQSGASGEQTTGSSAAEDL